MLRRLIVFPFDIRFVDNPKHPNERKRDRDLPEKLLDEAPGILAWLVKGSLAWQKSGLMIPDHCRIATETYQANEDLIGQFIQENLCIGDAYETSASDLYDNFSQWCTKYGHTPLSNKQLGQRVKILVGESKIARRDGKSSRVYSGIGIATMNSE